jgi:hypothetical protein
MKQGYPLERKNGLLGSIMILGGIYVGISSKLTNLEENTPRSRYQLPELLIQDDLLIIWHPPHLNWFNDDNPKDPLPCPANASMVQSTLVAALFLKEDGNVVNLQTGRFHQREQRHSGFHLIEILLREGKPLVTVQRAGRTILYAQGEEVSSGPAGIWNYNVYVITGRAIPGNSST